MMRSIYALIYALLVNAGVAAADIDAAACHSASSLPDSSAPIDKVTSLSTRINIITSKRSSTTQSSTTTKKASSLVKSSITPAIQSTKSISKPAPNSSYSRASGSGLHSSVSRSQSSASASNVIVVPGCPSIITFTTQILTVESTIYVNAPPTAVTTGYPVVTEYSVITTASTVKKQSTISIVISSYTLTDYTVTSIPATTTVYVPTPSNFLPVKCQSDYFAKTVYTTVGTVYRTTRPTITRFSTSTTTMYSTIYTATTTTSLSDVVTKTSGPSGTSTYTRGGPTSTVYAACAANNVTPDAPAGGGLKLVAAAGDNLKYETKALDATDCCSICQENSYCIASYYDASESGFNKCTLVYKSPSSNQTCSADYVAAEGSGAGGELTQYISNAACGRYVFANQVAPGQSEK